MDLQDFQGRPKKIEDVFRSMFESMHSVLSALPCKPLLVCALLRAIGRAMCAGRRHGWLVLGYLVRARGRLYSLVRVPWQTACDWQPVTCIVPGSGLSHLSSSFRFLSLTATAALLLHAQAGDQEWLRRAGIIDDEGEMTSKVPLRLCP